MAPQTFHFFPLLAPELQEIIWQHTISSIPPRVVELRDGFWTSLKQSEDPKAIISAGGHIADTTDAGLQKWEWQYTSPCYIPAPLHVCSLSRELALRRWRLAFADNEDGEGDGEELGEGKNQKFFFDFERDTLWVGEKVPSFSGFLKAMGRDGRKELRKLALGFDQQLQARNFRSGGLFAVVLIKEYPLLEEVVWVGSERKGAGEGEHVGDGVRKRGTVTFVENVDGAEDAFWVTRGVELDAFREMCTREGRHMVLKYMDYTREDPELFQMVDKVQWLQIGE